MLNLQEEQRQDVSGKLVLWDPPEIVQLAKVAPNILRMSPGSLTEEPAKGESLADMRGPLLTDAAQELERNSSDFRHLGPERCDQHAASQVIGAGDGERLLKGLDQQFRGSGQGRALGPDMFGVGVDGYPRSKASDLSGACEGHWES